MLLLWQDRPTESSRMEPTKTDMELLSNSMATYAHIKGNYGNQGRVKAGSNVEL